MKPHWHGILIHHSAVRDTEAADLQAYRRHHVQVRGWKDLGYHFVCEKLGEGFEVVAGRPLNMNGAHCPGKNWTHIGFCYAGDFSHKRPDVRMMEVGALHLAGLCDAFGMETAAIERHDVYRQTSCPGSLDIEGLRQLVDRFRG